MVALRVTIISLWEIMVFQRFSEGFPYLFDAKHFSFRKDKEKIQKLTFSKKRLENLQKLRLKQKMPDKKSFAFLVKHFLSG
jgi:hypothetical protein